MPKPGYSLIEVLVAMALFAIAVLGLSAGVALVVRSSLLSDNLTRATILAQDKLEELAARYTSLAGGSDTPQPGFTRDWSVTPNDPEAGVARVEVTVSWESGEPQTISLETVLDE